MATSFEVADPTVDLRSYARQHQGRRFPDLQRNATRLRAGVRKVFETGWRPMRFIASGCANKDTVMVPAGLEAASGIMSVVALKPYVPD